MFKRGQLPWIDDEQDIRNTTPRGFPREIVLSPRVRELFRLALGAGRTDPSVRPSMAQWARTLLGATDFTVICPECGLSYYASKLECPWCAEGRRPGMLYIEARRWKRTSYDSPWDRDLVDDAVPADDIVPGSVVWRKVLTQNVDMTIERHVLTTTLLHEVDPVCLRVEYKDNGLRLAPADRGDFHIVVPGQRRWEPLGRGKMIGLEDLTRPILLECRSEVRDRRILLLRHLPGEGP